MVRSPSFLASKYTKCDEERFDRILRFADENSLAVPRVSSASRLETRLAPQYFPAPTDPGVRENRDPGMDIHGPVHKSPQAHQ